MNDSAAWALVESLGRLDQMESTCKEDVSKSRFLASRYRAISARRSAYAESATEPSMKQADLVEAKNFEDKAKIEEGFVAFLIQLLAKMATRKRRMLARLEESKSPE
jgi:hypothetical protein